MAKKNLGVVPPTIMTTNQNTALPPRNVPPASIFPSHAAPIATAVHELQKMGSVTPPDSVMHPSKKGA